MEYKARRDCLKEYAKSINVEAIFEEEYGLEEFCKKTINNLNNRDLIEGEKIKIPSYK